MQDIILTTLNARYTHTSIALKYLISNLKELAQTAKIIEFVINQDTKSIAENILKYKPKIVGIGVYIWNAYDVSTLIDTIKKVSPNTTIVLGGPEVSYTPFRVNFDKADFIIAGEAEEAFYELCKKILSQDTLPSKYIYPQKLSLKDVVLPYRAYDSHDIAHRYIYVEASRGCPFSCEFCLSSIDKGVRYFDIDKLLVEFEELWQRGARNFKFIDRTFNLNMTIANKLIDFFLSKQDSYKLHFEVIPEYFPQKIKDKIKLFPKDTLQLEIGIQTLNKDVANKINRKMDFDKIIENIKFLENETSVHLHLDLIVGLPSESLESFGNNLNQLVAISNSEIQIGILKKLSGTTINRHDLEYGMVYSDTPPYDILQNDLIPFCVMQHMKRFARFWDMVYNSGDFVNTIKYIYSNGDIYSGFSDFTDWVYSKTLSTYQISQTRLIELVFEYITTTTNTDKQEVANTIAKDLNRLDGKGLPKDISKLLQNSN